MGVWVGWGTPWWPLLLIGAAGLAAAARRWSVALLVGLGAIGVVSGAFLADRDERMRTLPLPAGRATVLVEAVSDGRGAGDAGWVVARVVGTGEEGEYRSWDGPAGLLRGDVSGWRRSERWYVSTTMAPAGDHIRMGRPGSPVVWTGSAGSVRPAGVAGGRIGEWVDGARSLIVARLKPDLGRGRALLGGFLLGDTSHLDGLDVERMRRAGLSHFVAVSGSNVALFLGALFLVAGPLGWSSRRRAALGLAGLGFFVLLIGPDPSVVRAAAMAGLALLARPFGLRPDIWQVMGAAVALLLVTSPELAFSLGFQLSVAATAGVVIGAGWFPRLRPEWVGAALGASCGAQLAVAPILLLAIGSIPLWSPVANVLSAPLVVAATALGGAGAVIGIDAIVAAGALAAGAVLRIAEVAADLPQVGWGAVLLLGLLGSTAAWRRARPAAVVACAVVVAVVTLVSGPLTLSAPAIRPAFVALDVGQGDALLLMGEGGETILVDGGSSGPRVRRGLARFGVRAIDLLVVSHAHRDHYGGLTEVVESLPVGAVWYARFPGQAEEFEEFVAAARARAPVATPRPGHHRLGSIGLEVLGPIRRYQSLNDQSLVIVATIAGVRILLPGDLERIGQREMEPPAAAVLKVPHQGAATSDPAWLKDTGASVAVVSVGPNRFGHPSEELLAELARAGMHIRRTDTEGDVVIKMRP